MCCNGPEHSFIDRYPFPYSLPSDLHLSIEGIATRLAFDEAKDLFITSWFHEETIVFVTKFPYRNEPTRAAIVGTTDGAAAIDPHGRIFMTRGQNVLIFDPPYDRRPRTLRVTTTKRVVASGLVTDGEKSLYVLLRRALQQNGKGSQGYGIVRYSLQSLTSDWETGLQADPDEVIPGGFGVQPGVTLSTTND